MKKKTFVIFTLAAIAAAALTGVGCQVPDGGSVPDSGKCNHVFDYNSDDDKHWEECTLCHAVMNRQDHVDLDNDGVCDVCEHELAADDGRKPAEPEDPDDTEKDPAKDPDEPVSPVDPDEPVTPEEPDEEEVDDGSPGSKSNPIVLNKGSFSLEECAAGGKVYYSFTAPADGGYTVALYSGINSRMCHFTTDLDKSGVYYGYGYAAQEKHVELSEGSTIIIALVGGSSLPDDAAVSVTVTDYDGEDLPASWNDVASATYYNASADNALKFNQSGSTLLWGTTTCSYKYYGLGEEEVRFTSGSVNYTLTKNANGSLSLYGNGSTVTLIKSVSVTVDKFNGVFGPVTAVSGAPVEVCIYESGNGYYKLSTGSSAVSCKASNRSASFESSKGRVVFNDTYSIAAKDVDGNGNVTSVWVCYGNNVYEFTRTGDTDIEVPETLPLPLSVELKGSTYSIVCNNGYQTWSGSSRVVQVEAVTEVDGVYVYTTSNSGTKIYLSIAGSDEDTVVTIYSSLDATTVVDTLTVKTADTNELKIDGTPNALVKDDFTSNMAFLTVPELGAYTFTITEVSSSYSSMYSIYIYTDYDTETGSFGKQLNMASLNTPSVKVTLEKGSVIAVNISEYGSKLNSLSFTVTSYEIAEGTHSSKPIAIGVGENTISDTDSSNYYYAELEAEEDGVYKIICQGQVWGSLDYIVHFTVDGVVSGYVPDGYFYGYFYSNGEQIGDKYCGEVPFATVTLSAGQKVSLVLDQKMTSGSGDIVITVEKVS